MLPAHLTAGDIVALVALFVAGAAVGWIAGRRSRGWKAAIVEFRRDP